MNPTLNPTNGLRVVEARDADEHAANLTNWEQCYDQTTCGSFHGLLEEIQLPGMQVFRESTSQGMRQSCCVWPDAMWFGMPFSADVTRINGRTASGHSVLARPGHREFELVTPADYTIFGMVVRHDTLHSAACALGFDMDWERLQAAEILQPSPAALKQCLHTLSALLQPEAAALDPNQARTLALEALLPLLDTSEVDAGVRESFSRRQRVVAAARDYLLAHHDQSVTVPDLCGQLHVSRRTLQYCFEDVLGMTPVQTLRILRLNGARRDLRRNPQASVRDVAVDWNFWHFSQFASDYRKLFGYSPSATRRADLH
ncbi:helix-turn-helix domain-containing protein [Rhodoferax sp.]|uniref:helix-turn-helix domain-containing protein n=1 Tax=Rhodoferax sp. TaxID=50421 RepID=UPI0025E8F82A|nr:helix-turn-helix domain-containing protein [Rhodoferax sp.]